MSDSIQLSRIMCDFIILLLCGIPMLIFHEWVKPYKRGFYCDDESIRYPYRASTVSRQVLGVGGLLIAVVLIIGTELFRLFAWEKKCSESFKTYQCRQKAVHRFIVRLYCFLGYFFIGVCFNQLMVDIAKYTIGRQRPHFMEVCKPNVGYTTCTTPDVYITDFECTGADPKLVHESQLSFYSGHAAFSFYIAWFCCLYMQARLYRPLYSRLLLPVIQFTLLGLASYVALTRVSDYKHHWSDVLVGTILGSTIGIFNAFFVAEVFQRREIPSCAIPHSQDLGLIRMEKRADRPEVVTHSVTVTNEIEDAGQKDNSNQRLSPRLGSSHTAVHPAAPSEAYGPLKYSLSGESFYSARGDWDSGGSVRWSRASYGAQSCGGMSGATEYLSVANSWNSLRPTAL